MEDIPQTILNRWAAQCDYFEANEPGIVELKAEFLAEAEEYFYLRKGEDVGGDIIGFMSLTINALTDPDVVKAVGTAVVYVTAAEKVAKYYPAITKKITDVKNLFKSKPWRERRPRTLRLLLWPDARNEEARPLYEKQGYEVRFYKSELDKGKHRMYLNDKRYALFLRIPGDRFVGIIGKDKKMHASIKALFEQEWGDGRKPPP